MFPNIGQYARILVVDDSKTMCKIVRNMLDTLRFKNIDEASDGATAIKMIRARHYSLIISDWNMKPVSGLDLYDMLRSHRPSEATPFLMMTAHAGKFASVARHAGPVNYIAKPFTSGALADMIAVCTKYAPPR